MIITVTAMLRRITHTLENEDVEQRERVTRGTLLGPKSVYAYRSRHTMHLLGPRPSRNPDLSVEPTYYLFIRTVPGWSATWRNRLREFAELAFLARVPSELCLHSFRFGSLLFSTSSFGLVRFSVLFNPSHCRSCSPSLADLPSASLQRTHVHTHTPTLVLLFSPFLYLCHASGDCLSCTALVEHPPGTRPTLTFGLLCNQNNNNCFGTFDYSSIRVTADCLQLRVGFARLAIRG